MSISYEKAATSSAEELYEELGTGPYGLSSEEAKKRIEGYGRNIIATAKKASFVQKFVIQFKNLFNVLLLIAAFLSFWSGWFYNDTGAVQLAFAIAAVVIANVVFTLIQEHRAENAVEALRKLIPTNTQVTRDNQPRILPISEVVPGDIILLEEGDRVPADARLVSAFEIFVDNSALTGESEPQRAFTSILRGIAVHNVTDYHNIVFAGTTVVSGEAKGVVLSTGKHTVFGKIVAITHGIQEPLSPLQKEIDHSAKINFAVALLVAALFFTVALLFVNLTLVESLLFAIGVMVSLVPEGFQVTVSLALALSALEMSKRKVVVKRLSSVETLGSTTVICVDKTGTITRGEMMVKKLWAGGHVFEVTGDGYKPEGFVTISGRRTKPFERPHIAILFEVAAFANRAKLLPPTEGIPRWMSLGDPTDAALLVLALKGDFNIEHAFAENPRMGLIPFDPRRKMMTSIHGNVKRNNVVAYTKGACQEVLSRSTHIFYNNQLTLLTSEMRDAIKRQTEQFASEGFRVLAVALRVLPRGLTEFSAEQVEKEFTFLGLVAIHDPPRLEVEKAVASARGAGIKVVMITGDHELTAEAIAKKVGILTTTDHIVVSGYDLTRTSDSELAKILDAKEIVFARITPEQKLRIVKAIKAKGEIVAVTGDGVNDAPALVDADIGIAMGKTGTDVARESSDMVLSDDNFASIVNGIELGRAVFDNLKKFVFYVFVHNWAELVAFVAFILLRIPLPLLVVQILAIDLGMEILPSLALTLEPPEPNVMIRPPRRFGSRLMGLNTLLRALYIGVIIAIMALMGAFNTWTQGGWTFGQTTVNDPTVYAKGTTVFMAGIVAAQLGTLFAARTSVESVFRLNPLRNRWLLIGILAQVGMLLAVVYVPFLQQLFGTRSLSLSDWIYLYSIAPLILIIEEIRKMILRRTGKPTKAGVTKTAGQLKLD